MALSPSIARYLTKAAVGYDMVRVTPFASSAAAADAAGIPLDSLARAVVMMDTAGPVMVVVPGSEDIDPEGLVNVLRREVLPASPWHMNRLFNDCDSRFLPAIGAAYGIRTLIDERLVASDHHDIYLFAGDASHLLRFSRQAFLNLQATAWFAQGLGRPPGGRAIREPPPETVADTVESRLARLDGLPPMPGLAHEILALRADPKADARDLARLVQLDPSLAAQVMRYASAPFFGYRGRVDSLQTAISRVLGYEMVMHLAMGIVVARPFKLPRQGPLGLLAFWRHAVYSAATMQVLSRELHRTVHMKAGTTYLAGLLHNFGLIVVGHAFRSEYQQLCALRAHQPHAPLAELERQVLGTDHGDLGSRLLEKWGLPSEVVVTAREHHNPTYTGPHAEYVGLALLADRLLMNHGIGDAADATLPPRILASLNMDEIKVLSVMNRILQGCTGLDAMARQLAA